MKTLVRGIYGSKILAEEFGVGPSILTQKQRLDWERAAEYTQLFYRYCAESQEAGEVGGREESRRLISWLDEMKAGN